MDQVDLPLITRKELGEDLAREMEKQLSAPAPDEAKKVVTFTAAAAGKRRTKTGLLNRPVVRQLALDLSQNMRRGKFTRVSEEFIDDLEAQVRSMITTRVHRAPSKGKTL